MTTITPAVDFGQADGVTVEVLFASVPVADLREAVPWYEQLFGREADLVPNENEVMWRMTPSGWLYVVEDAERREEPS